MFSTTASTAVTGACRIQPCVSRLAPPSPTQPLVCPSIEHYGRGTTRQIDPLLLHRLWAEPSFLPAPLPGPGQEDVTKPLSISGTFRGSYIQG